MDRSWLQHALTVDEERRFAEQGYLIIENAIPQELVDRATAVVDRITAEEKAREGLGANDGINIFDFIGQDDVFLELLDYPTTFPKVWGILGWNIQLYHSHTIITPPNAASGPGQQGLNWHKDSGRLNNELETDPQPRISLKVAFFLTDTSELGRANLYVIPGSHLLNKLPVDEAKKPKGGLAVQAKPGDAVFFDRRIWHSSSPNTSEVPRKVLFYGYSYRWLRPRDNMTVDHLMGRIGPIRRQLLGAAPSGWHGYSSPKPEDVPLRAWLQENVGEQVAA
ncbi:MAG: phytanoyl-CoA dioxygenase family protein [Caldilineaceae bacterium]|nr:phytanoyl-CoA dioxygenase family protein [Caldilineaceae bacterium]MCY4117550.1 phytanoyl-CoA dioxygenase family protein [Caldilineaceae bacterium]MDE0068727.1 phytanoyl-CoA dioxygenase family protein [Caldilineaceae bacterium]